MGLARKVHNLLSLMGLDFVRLGRTFAATPRFIRDARRYKRALAAMQNGSPATANSPGAPAPPSAAAGNFAMHWRNAKPILNDYWEQAGSASGHYFFQDLWAARKIYERRPTRHLDIGSRLDGFVAHVLSFMPVEVIDIRPLATSVPGLSFIQSDATRLSDFADGSIDSLSSLHAIEHFGLGRYSDPIDPQACFLAMGALARVLKPGGRLYFSVPIGRERVEFNAHRVFAPQTILREFSQLRLVSFAGVDDAGDFKPDAKPDDFSGARFSCGLFEFTK